MLSNVCQHEYLHSVVIDNFPIKIDIFDMQLAAYPDRPKVEFIVNGLRTGFHGFFTLLLLKETNMKLK